MSTIKLISKIKAWIEKPQSTRLIFSSCMSTQDRKREMGTISIGGLYWEEKSFTQLDECLNKYEKDADKRPISLKKTWAEPLFLLFLFGENRLLPPTEQNNFSTTTTKGLNKLIAPNCTISLKTCFRGFYYCTMKPSCTKNRQAPALHPQLNADVNILALNILIDL